jgi:hypothetical protein
MVNVPRYIGEWEGRPRDQAQIQRLSELTRASNVADWEKREAENDLLAFRVTLEKPP